MTRTDAMPGLAEELRRHPAVTTLFPTGPLLRRADVAIRVEEDGTTVSVTIGVPGAVPAREAADAVGALVRRRLAAAGEPDVRVLVRIAHIA